MCTQSKHRVLLDPLISFYHDKGEVSTHKTSGLFNGGVTDRELSTDSVMFP